MSFTDLQNRILKVLDQGTPIIRKDIVDQLKIPRTTVYDNLLKLKKAKLVEKFSRHIHDGKGRPLVYWKVV